LIVVQNLLHQQNCCEPRSDLLATIIGGKIELYSRSQRLLLLCKIAMRPGPFSQSFRPEAYSA
jgi:hypothetical protein